MCSFGNRELKLECFIMEMELVVNINYFLDN